jgi:hypothetical protein
MSRDFGNIDHGDSEPYPNNNFPQRERQIKTLSSTNTVTQMLCREKIDYRLNDGDYP